MPALINTFLFVEPQQHYLNYGSLILHDIISKNKRAGQIITELIGNDANPEKVKEELNRTSPILFAGVGHGNSCYSEDTELLTENGWKHFADLIPNEKVATLSTNGELEYQLPTAYHAFDYKGKMFNVEGKRVNLLVTPNHNLYVSVPNNNGMSPFLIMKAKDIGQVGAKWGFAEDVKSLELIAQQKEVFELRKKYKCGAVKIARHLGIPKFRVQDWIYYHRKAGYRFRRTGKSNGNYLKFKRSAKWNCVQMTEFCIPSIIKRGRGDFVNIVPLKNIAIEDWLRFFGIWLAEGCTNESTKGHYRITITQTNDLKRAIINKWVEPIAKTLGCSIMKEESNSHSKALVLKNKQLFQYLRQFGKAKDKFIPKELKQLPPTQLKILLDAMVFGDGHIAKNGEVSYATISKRLADDIQEIALKIGRGAIISPNHNTNHNLIILNFGNGEVGVTKKFCKWVEYIGKIFCVTVPNHLIYVRRHGRPCWCGNSTYTVECTAKLFDTSSTDLTLLADRIVSLCSCLTAQLLGPAIIDAGAVVYTGYKEEFWFYIADEPGTTRGVQSPFLAEFQFVGSLLQGKNTGVAREDQLKKYNEEITYWISGDGKNSADASELSRILEMNKENSVFLGEGGIQPSSQGPTVLVAGTTPWLWILMGVAVTYLTYRELKGKSGSVNSS